jgi:hypothetical protein
MFASTNLVEKLKGIDKFHA